MALRAVTRRPVYIASFAPAPVAEGVDDGAEDTPAPAFRLRDRFPAAGEEAHGGVSDGYCFRITFAAGRLDQTLELLRTFLQEEGYADVPLPADAEELRKFRLPPKLRHQLSLFGEDGYVHNPVRVLFPPPGGKRGALILEVCNESAPGHLLRFHRRG
ncbi:hypothetical protein GGR26_002785 [Lewinella marina]|uniref:hypothetical protein n=1 Tax=Neolewinella marina TaxID=438751 RepID=UPI001691AE2D|nr:hypothetical protein [Neolewinella marina]NJB87008.1 hypothetical protein [Neolewinella marina]